MVEKKLQQGLTDDLLREAVEFHGHLGPFLILGLKAGFIGVSYLGKDYFKVKAVVATLLNPPRSCFIDGIQFASGCTVGKGNIEIKKSEGVSVEFTNGEGKISLTVREAILKALDHLSDEQTGASGEDILKKTDNELFLINKN